MHVKAHHMARPAREDQRVRPAKGNVLGIALHKAQVCHPFRNGLCRGKMGFPVRNARCQALYRSIKTAQVDVVYKFLALREFLSHRH